MTDPSRPTYLVGVDCAAQDVNCGLALGRLRAGRVSVLEVVVRQKQILPTLLRWFEQCTPALVAIDAPLGWPMPLSVHLGRRLAGDPIDATGDELFHRHTDRVVRSLTGKRPMEVGADKIARAALRAVNLLGQLRASTGHALPMAWSPGVPDQPSAIEVYPALTLRSLGLSDAGYKGSRPEKRLRRRNLAESIATEVDLWVDRQALAESDDALDAVVCLLAASHFCAESVLLPDQAELARTEGWIWFRPPTLPGASR